MLQQLRNVILPLPIHFPYTHSPKSDTCKVCDSLKVQIDAESDISQKRQLTLELDFHKVQAESSYHQLKEDAGLLEESTRCGDALV